MSRFPLVDALLVIVAALFYRCGMRIALLIDNFSPGKGGGEGYTAHLASGLAQRGHEVHVFCAAAGVEPPGVVVHRLPVTAVLPGRFIARFAASTAQAVEGQGFDIVHGVGKTLGQNVHNPHGGVEEAWLARHFQSMRHPAYRAFRMIARYASLKHRAIMSVQRRQYRDPKVRGIIAISDMIARDLSRWYPEAIDRTVVVYNGVDHARFSDEKWRTQRGDTRAQESACDRHFVLLMVSHNFRLKNLAGAIEVTARLRRRFPDRPALLWVLGRGKTAPYEALARRLGISSALRFLGARPDVERYYAAADLCLHPTYYDACSLAVFEALASGLPVVTTRCNGAGGIIHDGVQGFADLDPEDYESLATACAYFLDDDRRARAGRAARALMVHYDARDNLDRVLAVYRHLLFGEPLQGDFGLYPARLALSVEGPPRPAEAR